MLNCLLSVFHKVSSFVTLLVGLISISLTLAAGDVGGGEEKKTPQLLPDIVGHWVFDLDYVHEYLQKGSDIQKQWCGYGWNKAEISRREKLIRDDVKKNGPLVVYEISLLGSDSLKLKIKNNIGETKTNILSKCTEQDSSLIFCKQSTNSDRLFIFRCDGRFIYIMTRMSPDIMNCQVKKTMPAEIWFALMRLKRIRE